jgi:hypothetical protein
MDFKRFDDYKQVVVLHYLNRKKAGSLPRNLQDHTSANLKKECVDEFLSRYTEQDSETFKSFFGRVENGKENFQMVRNADPDLFKPLNNFLRKDTKVGTHNRNIELLAWLIDFKPRPFNPGDPYDLGKSELVLSLPVNQKPVFETVCNLEEESTLEDTTERSGKLESDGIESFSIKEVASEGLITKALSTEGKHSQLSIPAKFHKTVIAFLAVLLIMTCSYLFYDRTKPRYMYWDGQQYQSIAHDQSVNGVIIVPLDTFKLAHLRKIKDLSLITQNSIRKIYYAKTKGKVEFYTTKGDNPEDNNRMLMPMTEYIYKKYVLQRTPSN